MTHRWLRNLMVRNLWVGADVPPAAPNRRREVHDLIHKGVLAVGHVAAGYPTNATGTVRRGNTTRRSQAREFQRRPTEHQ